MTERAQITSVEAIESFRSGLIVYLSKARPTLEEISSEVVRTRLWLEERRRHWSNELRGRHKKLERAQAELFSAMLSNLQDVSAAQQMAVRRARAAVAEAEKKIAAIRKWDRDIENRSEPLIK